MTKLNIKITDMETNETKELDTDGFVLLHLDQDKVKMQGRMDLKTLAPILTRFALEKMSH